MSTAYLTCPLCEATCGLAVTLEGNAITSVRGDDEDAFSHGFICPKGASLKALHEDPDRLRHPMVKRDGQWHEVSWDEAFEEIDRRLVPIIAEHGSDAVAFYLGNPSSHNLGVTLYGRAFYRAVGTHNIYTAGSVDQLPKHYSSGHLFGDPMSIPVPDLDRTHHLLLLGANPLVSNGSLMTVPDARGRLKAIRDRGGKVVVVDPRRTRTAEAADEHHAIRPGTDALLLFGLVNVILREGLADLRHLADHVTGLDALTGLAARSPPRPSRRTPASRPPRSSGWRGSSPPPRAQPSTAGSGRPPRSSAPWPAGSSTSSTSSPATSTGRVARCSRSLQPDRRTALRHKAVRRARYGGTDAGAAGCGACRR